MQTAAPCTIAHIDTPPRVDLYRQVHKGLRAFMFDTLSQMGRLDGADDHAVKGVLDQVDQLLDLCLAHIDNEARHVHPAMQAVSPQSAQRIASEHEEHALAIDRLRTLAHAVACAGDAAREEAAFSLYRAMAVFVGENLAHMDIEETEHNAVLWANYSDDELQELLGAIVSSTSPAHMALDARWLVPSLSPIERTGLIGGLRASMPAEVFAAVLELIRPHLNASQWQRLCVDLGLAVAFNAVSTAQLVRRFTDAVFVRFDATEATSLVTADFVAHPWAQLGIPAGPDGIAPITAAFRTAFSEVSVTVDDVLADGDRVALRYRYAGRHTGDLFGIAPTGRRFEMAGILMARLEQGRVAEFWREEDMLGLQQQLGLASLLPSS